MIMHYTYSLGVKSLNVLFIGLDQSVSCYVCSYDATWGMNYSGRGVGCNYSRL